MWEVRVNQIQPRPSSLHLGCVVEMGENGPIRFVEVVVPWELFTREVRADMLDRFNKMHSQTLAEEPLW